MQLKYVNMQTYQSKKGKYEQVKSTPMFFTKGIQFRFYLIAKMKLKTQGKRFTVKVAIKQPLTECKNPG